MAQKQKRKKNKSWITWVIMLLLFVVAGVVCYFVWDAYFKPKDNNDGGDSTGVVEKPVENSDVEDGVEAAESGVIEKEKVVQYDGDDPNGAEELSGTVTYAGVSGDILVIRVNIDQYLEGGECVLNLVRNGDSVFSGSTRIVGGPSTSTCEGFDIPVSGLGGGEVQIVITMNSGGKSGTIRGEASL